MKKVSPANKAATKNVVAAKKISDFDVQVFLATIQPGHLTASYSKGKTVFLQGDPANAVFYVNNGRIKLVVASQQGKEAVIGMLGKGDFFGESCLIGQPLRLATAKAMSDSDVMRIDLEEMRRILQAEPVFAETFMLHLLIRSSRLEEDLVDQLFNSSEKRLARVLLLLANFGNEGKPQPITTMISQETLAKIIGTTRPRVSFFMNKFRKLGFIDYNGHLEVHSSLLSVLLDD